MSARIGVTRTSPMGPTQKRPSTPLWVTWKPRGEDDPRPWVVGDSELGSPELRPSSECVIDLTDVPSMTMNYTNIREALDFMGVNDQHYLDLVGVSEAVAGHDEFGARIYTPGHGEIWLGQGTTVWKLPDGRCYIQHRVSPTTMFVWPPVEVKL